MVIHSFSAYVMAMKRVQERLIKVTSALNAGGIRYAVIGGHAVAVWVAKADPSATRTTIDVDLLVERHDVERVTKIMADLGFQRHDPQRQVRFTDPEEPSRRSGVHLVWAAQTVRPSYTHPAPRLDEAVLDPQGFWVLNLAALVRMKLTSMRDIDRVHVADIVSVGLIDTAVRKSLSPDLLERLTGIEESLDED